jgi:hypothetical protein
MIRVCLLTLGQYGPDGMEFPVFTQQVVPAKFLRWDIPYSHMLPTYLQQLESSPPHETSSVPFRAARIIAYAHPTPLSTEMAPVGQLSWHAPHSIHERGSTNRATFSFGENTPWGQTILHIPQLIHSSGSYSRVLDSYELNITVLQIS